MQADKKSTLRTAAILDHGTLNYQQQTEQFDRRYSVAMQTVVEKDGIYTLAT